MNEMKTSVEQLYRVFANYPLAGPVEGCPCCVDTEDKQSLVSGPLSELTVQNLNHYSRKAMTTWGGVQEFKHFLPRIFELALSDQGLETDIEVVIGKLNCAEWSNWPVAEKEAVKAYLAAGWKHILSGAEQHVEPTEWLCGVGLVGVNLAPYFEVWVNSKTKSAYEQLLGAVTDGWVLQNAFWDDAKEAKAHVREWMESAQTTERLEKLYFENERADFAKPLAKCVDVLKGFQKV